MNISYTNCLESSSIRCGDNMAFKRSVVLKLCTIGAIMTACTIINAGTKLVLWKFKSFGECNIVGCASECK